MSFRGSVWTGIKGSLSSEFPIENVKRYNSDGKISTDLLSLYESSNVTTREIGKSYSKDGQTPTTWLYDYINAFDNDGKLVLRTCKQLRSTTEYEYSEKGLLIKKTFDEGFGFPIVEEFKYEYWN
ncbi:MAG: hypothetical protein JKY42_01230 [Flavobacteriales bacterium]|nr:hypothetical protein [Flavobacteriales bacterium]